MKKHFLIVLFLVTFSNLISAQKEKYPLTLEFSSICCGTPDEKPIFDCINTFKSENNIKYINYIIVNGLGEEGEHAYLFSLKEVTINKRKKLISKLKIIIAQITKNRKDNHDGYIGLSENVAIEKWCQFIKNSKSVAF